MIELVKLYKNGKTQEKIEKEFLSSIYLVINRNRIYRINHNNSKANLSKTLNRTNKFKISSKRRKKDGDKN